MSRLPNDFALSNLSRRGFLKGVGATGALVLGWSVMPPRQRLTTASPLPVGARESALNGWVKIDADGSVTVMLAKSEMGQGVATSLCMLLAEELDADWSRVRFEASPIDKIYNNIATVVDGLPVHPDTDSRVLDTASCITGSASASASSMLSASAAWA